jgi:hypothetical protein
MVDLKKIYLKNNRGVTFVDDCDHEYLSQFNWYLNINKTKTKELHYVQGWVNKKLVRLHRLLMNPDKHMVVDHIDGNGLNNLRNNLRVATKSQNEANARSKTKKFKGVYFDKRKSRKKWYAYIQKDGKMYGLKYHLTEKDAAIAYNNKAKELYGDFALLNEV